MNKIFAPSTAAALLAVLTLGVAGTGWTEGMEKGMNDMSEGKALTQEERNAFSKLDINKDGKISQEEAKKNGNLAGKFDSVDSNHDKSLDIGEFARFETETDQGM